MCACSYPSRAPQRGPAAHRVHPRPRGARVHPRPRGTQEREPAYAALGLVFDPVSFSRDIRTRTGEIEMRRTCPGGSEPTSRSALLALRHLSSAGGTEPCADEDVGAPRHPATRPLGLPCPPRAGLNRVPTRTSARPGTRPPGHSVYPVPAGGGESAVPDLGVDSPCGVWWRITLPESSSSNATLISNQPRVRCSPAPTRGP